MEIAGTPGVGIEVDLQIVVQDLCYSAVQGGGIKIANSDSNIDSFFARRRDNSGFGGGAQEREYR